MRVPLAEKSRLINPPESNEIHFPLVKSHSSSSSRQFQNGNKLTTSFCQPNSPFSSERTSFRPTALWIALSSAPTHAADKQRIDSRTAVFYILSTTDSAPHPLLFHRGAEKNRCNEERIIFTRAPHHSFLQGPQPEALEIPSGRNVTRHRFKWLENGGYIVQTIRLLPE